MSEQAGLTNPQGETPGRQRPEVDDWDDWLPPGEAAAARRRQAALERAAQSSEAPARTPDRRPEVDDWDDWLPPGEAAAARRAAAQRAAAREVIARQPEGPSPQSSALAEVADHQLEGHELLPVVRDLKISWINKPRDPEERERIEEEAREGVNLSVRILEDGLGLNPDDLGSALKEIQLFNPYPEPTTRFGRLRRGVRRIFRNTIDFEPQTEGDGARGTYSEVRPLLRMSLEDGEVAGDVLTHEINHAFMKALRVGTNKGTSRGEHGAALLEEGLGALGNLLYNEAMDRQVKRMPKFQFKNYIDELENGESIAHRAYDDANAWLQRYLWVERGGADMMRQVSQVIRGKPTEAKLIKAYEVVYGEPLTELIRKTEEWYQDRLQHQKVLGDR